MPDPTAPALPMALSQLPAKAVHAHFATRPVLYSVVFNALRNLILERYPTLELNLLDVQLAIPTSTGHYTYRSLMEVTLAHVLNPQSLDLHSKRELPYYLTQQIPKILKPVPPALIDMKVIAQIIDELRSSLYLYFQYDLADYWSVIDSHGNSRWQWLGTFLNGQMTAAAAGQSSLNDTQRDMLTVVAAWPVLLERLPHSSPPTYTYFIENTFTTADKQARLLTPHLLLVREKQVLLYSVAGVIEAFDSIDAFGQAWGTRMQDQYQFDSMTWRRNEPDGNVFEQQAGLILNQQLEDLATLVFEGQDEKTLERRLDKITDPALLFTNIPTPAAPLMQKVSDHLPEWFKQATATDSFAYHRHLQDMARVLRQNQGRSFDQGIESIHRFSREALRKQMQADHEDFDPDEVVLDFTVAAGLPGTAGIIEHVRMSLTELALKNLAGKPSGVLKLSSKGATPLPAWLNEEYLLGRTGLIQRVDIGTTYPQKIKDLLLSDTDDARQRETLFTRELKVKLPMLALECKIRQLNGVTVTGYRYVKALMGEMPTDRVVDEQEIVLRPLALCRKPGARPDEVNNVFIIEPRDASVGPHLLYRPLYDEALHEFPTRQALLDALVTPGELQDSILTWLTDKARPIYDHGGIKEPHIVHFLPGDEFTPPEKPSPATLAIDEGAGEWMQSQINGQLLSHLFGSTARALVDLADRESVSNSESRWAVMMEGAWLLFNTLLLPLVQGPAMLVGWFMVLVSSLEQDLAGLDSEDPTTRELALIDLLLNTAMVLLHTATPTNRSHQPLSEPSAAEHTLPLRAWRRTVGLAHQQPIAEVRIGSVAFPGEPPATGHTTLDFSRSIASPQASAKLLKALLEVKVPWPDPPPSPLPTGVLKGLYWIEEKWHASVGGLLFQVSVVPGFGDVYLIDPQHPLHPGFRLVTDGQGHWRLDRHARLEAGMRRTGISALRALKTQRIAELGSELAILNQEAQVLAKHAQPFNEAVVRSGAQLDERLLALRKDWELLSNPELLPALRPRIAERHEQRQASTLHAKSAWGLAFENYQENTQPFINALEASVAKVDELIAVDRVEKEYTDLRNNVITNIYQHWLFTYGYLHKKISLTLQTPRGESLLELLNRMNRELPDKVTDGYKAFIRGATQRLEALKEALDATEKYEATLKQAGAALHEKLLRDFNPSQPISSFRIKQNILLAFIELLVNRALDTDKPEQRPFLDVLTDRQLYASINTHTEIQTTTGYSTSEQMDVFKNLLQQYEQLGSAVSSLIEMGSPLIQEDYSAPFLEQLSEARADVEARLANLILIEEKITPQPAQDKTKRQKPSNRRVIKTVDKKSLVGDMRPRTADASGNYVDIKDPFTNEIFATYHEHASENVWKIVYPDGPKAKSPAPAARSLKRIKADAQTLDGQRAGIDASILFQQRGLREPSRVESLSPYEWDVMLSQHAEKFEALATELKRDHSANTGAIVLIDEYQAKAGEATTAARIACAEGYKLQRPKADKVAYLWKHGFVDINLLGSRIPLAAGDFLTEYVIRDRSKIKAGATFEETVLWYAHFHYPAVDTPPSQSPFGHLKTKEDRRFTRAQLIEKARSSNRALVIYETAKIWPPLDQELFLKLEVLIPE